MVSAKTIGPPTATHGGLTKTAEKAAPRRANPAAEYDGAGALPRRKTCEKIALISRQSGAPSCASGWG
jgi:hypothetical protein